MDEFSNQIGSPRSNFYKRDHFDSLFDLFDNDDDGYLTKKEMTIFVSKIFRNSYKKVAK